MALTVPIQIEAMQSADVPAVLEIERLSFLTPWPPEAFTQELTHNRLARYVVARRGGVVVAYAGVWLMVDEAHITTFAVHPDVRRQGIGRRLLQALLVTGEEMGANRLTLEVRVSNVAAQALYRGQGFEIAGRRERYYTDDGEDALIMTTPSLRGESMRPHLAAAHAAEPGEPADGETAG